MATYHWGSGHFKQYHFAAYHWGGVLAPVPVLPGRPSGGGPGLWPWWRLEEKPEICEEWAQENVDKFKCELPKWKKKLDKMDPLEKIGKEKELSEIEKKNQAIRALRDEVKKLARELDKTREGDEKDKKSRRRMRLKIKRLLRTISSLMTRIQALEVELEEARKRALEAPAGATVPAAAVAEPFPLEREIAFLQAYKDELVGRLRRSFPWALGAGIAYLGTRHLVPQDMPWLKFAGYSGTAILSLVAVFKFLDIDFGLDWLWPGKSARRPEFQV